MKRRPWTTPEKEKHQLFGKKQSDKREDNCQKVYEVILAVREATTAQIEEILEKRNEALSKRTVERCIGLDDRIIKKGKKSYSIDEWARLETRYLNPLRFAVYLWSDVVSSESFNYDDGGMKKMLEMFGAILMFVFIEASRPFQDKLKGKRKTMTNKDRNDLVKHWALNSIPLDFMFSTFNSTFNFRSLIYRGRKETKRLSPFSYSAEPRREMEQFQVDECLDMLRRINPDIYHALASAKNRFYENALSGKDLD